MSPLTIFLAKFLGLYCIIVALAMMTRRQSALAIGIAVHCDGCVAYHTKMAYQHGATREEVAETVALAVYMGGGPAAVFGGDALRAYDQFASSKP